MPENHKVDLTFVKMAVVFVAATWLGNWLFAFIPNNDRGTFGDIFGIANSLFSGAAFIGIMYAISQQRLEIKIARDEIIHTKGMMVEQQKNLSLQNKETKRQMFENTFFQMLRLLTDITSQMDIVPGSGVPTKGKDVFPFFIRRLKEKYFASAGGNNFEEGYEDFYQKYNADLGHYFRVIYNILKYVDSSEMEDKRFYSNILRAQLSDAEIAILFHNGLAKHGVEKLKPLMEKYSLLKNANDKDLLDLSLKGRYADSAFRKIL
jgi:hypothetical protein